jgi:hypothetical protein
MLRIRFCVCLLLAAGFISHAGAQDSSRWSIFVKAGYNTSDMAGSSSLNYALVGGQSNNNDLINNGVGGQKLREGWNGGIGVAYRLGKKVLVSLGLDLEAKGGVVQLNEYFPSGAYTNQYYPVKGKSVYALNYLTVPAYLRWYPVKKSGVYLQGGLYYGYLVSAEEHGKFAGSGQNSKYSSDIIDNYNHDDFGYTAGIGWERRFLKKGRLFFELDWERSFYTLGSSVTAEGKPEIYNQSLSLSAGYRLPL